MVDLVQRRGVQHYGNASIATDRTRGCNVTIWLKPDEYRKLDDYARAVNLSRTAVVRQLIQDYLNVQRVGP